MNEILKVIKERRTTRKFKTEQIKDVELKEIIEAGLYAPSGGNQQSWNFTVIQNQELIQELNDTTKEEMKHSSIERVKKVGNNEKANIFYNAPTVILVSGKEDNLVPEVDCSAATENILLAAEGLDIGACWVGIIRTLFANTEKCKKYMEKLQIPEGFKPYHAIALGYKDVRMTKPIPRRENTVQYLK